MQYIADITSSWSSRVCANVWIGGEMEHCKFQICVASRQRLYFKFKNLLTPRRHRTFGRLRYPAELSRPAQLGADPDGCRNRRAHRVQQNPLFQALSRYYPDRLRFFDIGNHLHLAQLARDVGEGRLEGISVSTPARFTTHTLTQQFDGFSGRVTG